MANAKLEPFQISKLVKKSTLITMKLHTSAWETGNFVKQVFFSNGSLLALVNYVRTRLLIILVHWRYVCAYAIMHALGTLLLILCNVNIVFWFLKLRYSGKATKFCKKSSPNFTMWPSLVRTLFDHNLMSKLIIDGVVVAHDILLFYLTINCKSWYQDSVSKVVKRINLCRLWLFFIILQ